MKYLNPSTLKTERPPVTCARSNSYCGRRNRLTAPPAPPASAGSFIGAKRTFGETLTSAMCQTRKFPIFATLLIAPHLRKPPRNRRYLSSAQGQIRRQNQPGAGNCRNRRPRENQ